ncbi:hypothetical protein C8J57DRAFT_1497185 [Mycena rebaudengoi]|nr:hypothetical protein C8J57DRAFT_1497185 [Mycena rebaudengoi]
MTRGKYHGPKEHLLPEAQPWPLGLEDIAPHGTKSCVASLSQWLLSPGHGHDVVSRLQFYSLRLASPPPGGLYEDRVQSIIWCLSSFIQVDFHQCYEMMESLRVPFRTLLPQILVSLKGKQSDGAEEIRRWCAHVASCMGIPLVAQATRGWINHQDLGRLLTK